MLAHLANNSTLFDFDCIAPETDVDCVVRQCANMLEAVVKIARIFLKLHVKIS